MVVKNSYLDEDEFTEKDQVLIEMASRGQSQREMAAETGWCTRQIQRRLAEPKMKAAVRQFCREMFAMRIRSVQSHFEKMENCFVSILDDDEADVYAKIAAATQIKAMCFHARELDVEDEMDELRDKIAAIEDTIGAGSAGGDGPIALIGNNADDE